MYTQCNFTELYAHDTNEILEKLAQRRLSMHHTKAHRRYR